MNKVYLDTNKLNEDQKHQLVLVLNKINSQTDWHIGLLSMFKNFHYLDFYDHKGNDINWKLTEKPFNKEEISFNDFLFMVL